MSKVIFGRGITMALAFLFALNAPALADEEQVRVFSNRIQVTELIIGFPGPVVVALPGFGEIFVALCNVSGENGSPGFGFRNKTNDAVELFGAGFVHTNGDVDEDNIIQPGDEGQLDVRASSQYGGPAAQNHHTFQLGAGAGRNRRVTTVVVSSSTRQGACLLQVQAVVHRL